MGQAGAASQDARADTKGACAYLHRPFTACFGVRCNANEVMSALLVCCFVPAVYIQNGDIKLQLGQTRCVHGTRMSLVSKG